MSNLGESGFCPQCLHAFLSDEHSEKCLTEQFHYRLADKLLTELPDQFDEHGEVILENVEKGRKLLIKAMEEYAQLQYRIGFQWGYDCALAKKK